MSRIGKMPIAIPAGVTVEIAENNKVTVKGPKGTLERVLPSEMDIKMEGSEIVVSRPNDLKKMKSLHGLTRTLINNMVIGVTEGYEKKLENFDVDLFIFKNFKRSLFSVSSSDLKIIRAAVKSFNNVSRVRLDEFNFISVEYVESPVVPVVEEPVTETVSVGPVTPVAEEPVAEEPVSEKQEEAIPSAIKALPVPISNRVTNDDIEEVEYEEVSNTERKPSDYIRQQSILIPNTFRWGRLF